MVDAGKKKTHPVSTTGRTARMSSTSWSLRARASGAENRSGHSALAACRGERGGMRERAAGRWEELGGPTFQAERADSPQESHATPSKSRAHSWVGAAAIALTGARALRVLRSRAAEEGLAPNGANAAR